MVINYSNYDVIVNNRVPSIFLAGPTPREKGVLSWRRKAIDILKQLEYPGIVYVPEYDNDLVKESYIDQAQWERKAMQSSSCISFWVDRDLNKLPGYTTNVEFGYWIAKKTISIVYGRPNNAPKTKYLDWLYRIEKSEEPVDKLTDLMKQSVEVSILNVEKNITN